jgi:hypothetical protein
MRHHGRVLGLLARLGVLALLGLLGLAVGLQLSGCGAAPGGGPAAGAPDGAGPDAVLAGGPDAGTTISPGDASPGPDLGSPPPTDAVIAPSSDGPTGNPGPDAVTTGPPPRPDQPALPCTDAPDDVYVTPPGLAPMDDAARGQVVTCAADGQLTAADAGSAVASAIDGAPAATSDVVLYRIAYRTFRDGNVDGLSSARVYLPRTPRASPAPLVVIAHPSVGIADSCAPTRDPSSLQDLALPFAATGHVVIAPDYPGLGGDGVHAYLDNRDAGQSLLDAVLAARQLLAPGALADGYLLAGFSQGGGAVLSARALARTYGARAGTLVATAAVAPEWPIRLNSFGYVDLLRNPDQPTFQSGLSRSSIAVLMQYGYFANAYGQAMGGMSFPDDKRDDLTSAINSLCLLPLGGHLQIFEATLGDLMDDTLRQGVLACVDQGLTASACQGAAKDFTQHLTDNVLPSDGAAGPVLLVQGLADQILPPAGEAACIHQKLVNEGVPVTVCTDPLAAHSTVMKQNMAHVLAWSVAQLGGQPPPSCDSNVLPDCTP